MSTYANKRIWSIERLNNSVNGNPRYRIAFEDDAVRGFRTSSDHGFCYAIGNPDLREGSLVRVQFTRAGLISDMQPITQPRDGETPEEAICDTI